MKIKDSGVMDSSWVRGHKNSTFINNVLKNNGIYYQLILSLDFAQKCPQSAGNAISETFPSGGRPQSPLESLNFNVRPPFQETLDPLLEPLGGRGGHYH